MVLAFRGLAACIGDCDDSRDVQIPEIMRMVNIVLGRMPMSACEVRGADSSGTVEINDRGGEQRVERMHVSSGVAGEGPIARPSVAWPK